MHLLVHCRNKTQLLHKTNLQLFLQSIVTGEHWHYSSGSSDGESYLFEDSKDSYRSSDYNDEDNPSNRDSSEDSDDRDNVAIAPTVPTPIATWSSCENVSIFSFLHRVVSNQIRLFDILQCREELIGKLLYYEDTDVAITKLLMKIERYEKKLTN